MHMSKYTRVYIRTLAHTYTNDDASSSSIAYIPALGLWLAGFTMCTQSPAANTPKVLVDSSVSFTQIKP